jgi:hypothetical protein
MATKQKQKQKQTVIVNIGSNVVKKRKRKPKKKKSAAGSSRSSMPPPPPPSMDLRQVLYPPQPQIRGDDNLAIQLNSVTKQLQDLQDKQQHRTANLMAGARAIAREEGAQGSVMEEPVMAPKAKRRTKQQMAADALAPPPAVKSPLAPPPADESPVGDERRGRSGERDEPRQPKLNKDGTPKQPRRSRSDKGKERPLTRGQSVTRVAHDALAHGGRLAVIMGGNTPEPGLSAEATATSGGMVFN